MTTNGAHWHWLAPLILLGCGQTPSDAPHQAPDGPRVAIFGLVREIVPPIFPIPVGSGVAGAEVCLLEPPGGNCTRTDLRGRYHLPGVPKGERVIVTVRKDSYHNTLFSFVPDADLYAGDNWAPFSYLVPDTYSEFPAPLAEGTGAAVIAVATNGLRTTFSGVSVAIDPPAGDGPYFYDNQLQRVPEATSFDGSIATAAFTNLPPGDYRIRWTVEHPDTERCGVLFSNRWGAANPYGIVIPGEDAIGVVVRAGFVSSHLVLECVRTPQEPDGSVISPDSGTPPPPPLQPPDAGTEPDAGTPPEPDAGTPPPPPEPDGGTPAAPPRMRVVDVRKVGTLDPGPTIMGRDGGYSAPFRGSLVWIFGDTFSKQSDANSLNAQSSTWSFGPTTVGEGSMTLGQPTDAAGLPARVVALNDEELQYNATYSTPDCADRSCAWLTLWPSAFVADPERDRLLVFYTKLRQWNFVFGFEAVGFGLAEWIDLQQPAKRLVFNRYPNEPTLLTTEHLEAALGSAALIEGGMFYSFRCGKVPQNQYDVAKPCLLARADVRRVAEADAWSYWVSGDSWSPDPVGAAALFDGNNLMSVAYNEYLGGYLAIYSLPLSNSIVMRVGQTLHGPWSDEVYAFEAPIPPTELWIYDGLGHPELQRDGGRLQYVTYSLRTGDYRSEMQLFEVELGRP